MDRHHQIVRRRPLTLRFHQKYIIGKKVDKNTNNRYLKKMLVPAEQRREEIDENNVDNITKKWEGLQAVYEWLTKKIGMIQLMIQLMKQCDKRREEIDENIDNIKKKWRGLLAELELLKKERVLLKKERVLLKKKMKKKKIRLKIQWMKEYDNHGDDKHGDGGYLEDNGGGGDDIKHGGGGGDDDKHGGGGGDDDEHGGGGRKNEKKDDSDGNGNGNNDKGEGSDNGSSNNGNMKRNQMKPMFGCKFGYHAGNENWCPVGQLHCVQKVVLIA